MDQLKVFLRQCVKYRFWIAVGISLILPIIGWAVGAGAINTVTTAREGEIKNAKTEVGKYASGTVVNQQYQPLAAAKKDVLVRDVDATWEKLFASQEPLLKWPPEVQERFRAWGRKYPETVDKNQVRSTIIDYVVSYPQFVDQIYSIFKPFNFEDGSGIVVADESNILLQKATFSQDEPPDLTKIWSEQERLWVVTALLDVVGKVNDSVGAKDWDTAIIKRIKVLEVGAASDQDQKSIAKGDTLLPADVLADPAAPAAAAAAPSVPSMGGGEGVGGPKMGEMMGGGPGMGAKTNEVLYIKTESTKYKILPIKMVVQVDQAHLPDFLVGLENSPMAIQVSEVEINKPLAPVEKPAYGERSSFMSGGMGGMMMGGGRGEEMMMGGGAGGPGAMGRAMGGVGNRAAAGGGGSSSMEMMMGGMAGGRGGAAAPKAKTGVDNRSKNDAKTRQDREKKEKEATKAKGDLKKIDQYYNVIEVTVYGQARFYLAPPPPVAPEPSTAAAPPAEAPQPPAAPGQAPTSPEAPKAAEPQAEPATPKTETPKAEAPKEEAPKPDGSAPKS